MEISSLCSVFVIMVVAVHHTNWEVNIADDQQHAYIDNSVTVHGFQSFPLPANNVQCSHLQSKDISSTASLFNGKSRRGAVYTARKPPTRQCGKAKG